VSVAGVVLAAGMSRRLGSAKQMARLGEQTLLERAVGAAVDAGLRPVYLVVAAGLGTSFCISDTAGTNEQVVITVENPEAAEGMAASVRAGVRAVGDAPGVVILACDQPAVTAEHLRLLAEGGDAVVASAYAGGKGVPAYFPARVFGALLALQGDTGARVLLREARAVELPGGELDVDTIQDLELAQRLYERPAKR
jgi:molybdenum cofactor cytidylyltransferase